MMNNLYGADLLEQVVEYIDARGWTQGNYHDLNGHCLLGAAERVIGKSANAHSRMRQALNGDNCDIDTYAVAVINDAASSWGELRDIVLNRAKELRNDS